MAFMKTMDPDLRKYLRGCHLPEIYEALLSGMCVMRPESHTDWIAEKLRELKLMDISELEWDTFIDESLKPKHPFIDDRFISLVFRGFGDDCEQYRSWDEVGRPSPEMMALACNTYNISLKAKCFHSWREYHLRYFLKIRKSAELSRKAVTHHNHRKLGIILMRWHEWTQFRLNRQSMAYELIQRVCNMSLARIMFQAWHTVAIEARRTREYFERLEQGEQVEDDDIFSSGGDGEARDDLSRIPNQARNMLFSYLNLVDQARCARVCRAWKMATQNSQLWNRVDLGDIRDCITDRVASRLLHRYHPYLIHLSLRGCESIGKETFLMVASCRNLQDINLSECSTLTDDYLTTIVSGCIVLLYLNISYTQITDGALRSLTKNATNLQYLSLAHCQHFSDVGIDFFVKGKGGRKLIYIDLSGCRQISAQAMATLSEGSKGIRHWILNDIPELTDEHIAGIAAHCKHIETFEVMGAEQLTDETFRLVSSRSLKRLKVDGGPFLTDGMMRYLGKHGIDLQHFYLSDCPRITDQGFKMLCGLRHLRVANLADCVRVSDAGVRSLVDSPSGLYLRELNLTNCLSVGDAALQNITKRCQQLVYFSVAFCQQITEAGLETLGNSNSISFLDLSGTSCGDVSLSALGNNQHLRHLILSDCPSITDLGLQKLAQQCPFLEHLDVSLCYQLTDGAIKSLAFCCRYLTTLNLAGCKQLTDQSVQFVSGVCRHLKRLNLSGCIYVTEKSLKYLRKGCRKLQKLTMLYCKAVSKNEAVRMSQSGIRFEFSQEDPPPEYCGYQG